MLGFEVLGTVRVKRWSSQHLLLILNRFCSTVLRE